MVDLELEKAKRARAQRAERIQTLKAAKRRPIRAQGYVWCDKHSAIHDANTTDPYGYGGWDDPDHCAKEDHRPVYVLGQAGEEF